MAAPACLSLVASNDARPVFDPTGRVLSIPTRALYDRRVKDYHLAVLCTLGDLDARHRDGWFEVSQAAIARFRGKSRTAITNAFSDLLSWGYVERAPQIDAETGRKRANRYRLRFDADLEDDHARHRDAPAPPPAGHVTGDDHTGPGMSLGVTYQTGYVTGDDMEPSHPNGYVTGNDHTNPGMSAEVTAQTWYVSGDDDYLKTLKDSEDLKEGARDQERPGLDRADALQLVALFEAHHRTYFGSACRPDHERLVSEAAAFAADGLPMGLTAKVIDTVFGRLAIQGHRHVSSFKALNRTWSFIATRWREAGRPMDDDGWEDLFDENRYAWRDFQAAFPRPDGLKADATRKAFDRAVRAAGDAPRIVEAARRYAARMEGRENRWLKTAERWLAGGHWREEAPGAAVPPDGEATPPDLSSVGTVSAPELAGAWPRAVKDLGRRVGASMVKAWLGKTEVGLGASGQVVIRAASGFCRDQIQNRFGYLLDEALSQALGRSVTTEVTVA